MPALKPNLMSNTKQALIDVLLEQAELIAQLRAELSAVKVQRHVERNVRPQTEHEYSSREEAIAACKRLVASEHNQRAVFSVVGTKVIARARAH